jgi:hypothetical protein
MKCPFDNEPFSFETLRAAGFAVSGGAHHGEVVSTAKHIGEDDGSSWHQAWKATVPRVAEIAVQARAYLYSVGALEALLRASNYHRTVGEFMLEKPATSDNTPSAARPTRRRSGRRDSSNRTPCLTHRAEAPVCVPGNSASARTTDAARRTQDLSHRTHLRHRRHDSPPPDLPHTRTPPSCSPSAPHAALAPGSHPR